MVPKVEVFEGVLRVEDGCSWLVMPNAGGEASALFFNVPTGAAYLDGFKAVTDYLQQKMKKHNGDLISITGIRARLGALSFIELFLQEDCLPSSMRPTRSSLSKAV